MHNQQTVPTKYKVPTRQCTTNQHTVPTKYTHTMHTQTVYVKYWFESKKTSLFQPVVAVFSPLFPPEGAPSPSWFFSSVIPFHHLLQYQRKTINIGVIHSIYSIFRVRPRADKVSPLLWFPPIISCECNNLTTAIVYQKCDTNIGRVKENMAKSHRIYLHYHPSCLTPP